jgi:exopolyphosphatase/guanosine-5'-triphosphate,3'-diphosphate pyrophosphatase
MSDTLPLPQSLQFERSQPEQSDHEAAKKRIAAIDLGTNSFHAIIVDVYPDGSFRRVDKIKEMIRLGENMKDQHLGQEAMDRGIEALQKIKMLCDHQDVEKILAYATSAIREADNGGAYIQRIIDEVQIKALAIPGRLEAELVAHAVQHAVSLGGQPALIMDVGGGSVEFIIADKDHTHFLSSKKVGVARLLGEFVHHDPIKKKEIKALRAFFKEELDDVLRALKAYDCITLVGSSGTMENIAEMVAKRENLRTSVTLNEFSYSPEQFEELYDEVIEMEQDERDDLKGLDDKRVDLIVPGLILVEWMLDQVPFEQIRTSDQALREGMILKYIKEEMDELELMEDFPSPRRRSVFELLRKYNWHREHSEHVTKLALKLFDETREIHKMDEADRELLEYASLMHDIGYHISHRKHHKHALYLIRHADLKGFSSDEIEVMANVARYHRRSTPKTRHKRYRKLRDDLKLKVRVLGGILRVADGLDRSHFQNVQRMDVAVADDQITLWIQPETDPELEIWGAMRKRHLFEEMMGRNLVIEGMME